jgi:hypothetical protein
MFIVIVRLRPSRYTYYHENIPPPHPLRSQPLPKIRRRQNRRLRQLNFVASDETRESNSKIRVAGIGWEIGILNRQRKSAFAEIKRRRGNPYKVERIII